jgi:hypothetical protein
VGVTGAKPPIKVTLFHELYSDFTLSKQCRSFITSNDEHADNRLKIKQNQMKRPLHQGNDTNQAVYTSSRWGPEGCAPGKFFKLQMHAGEF